MLVDGSPLLELQVALYPTGKTLHCRHACVYTATRSREVHMYGKICGVRGGPPVVRLPKKPNVSVVVINKIK